MLLCVFTLSFSFLWCHLEDLEAAERRGTESGSDMDGDVKRWMV